MRKYFLYLILYSVGGFILERIINLVFLGYYYDNSVLYGPWQPLYGAGILMAVIVYDLLLKRFTNKVIRYGLLLIVSIITTGLSEAVTGYGYEWLYGVGLWNYGSYFTCQVPYVCAIPTSIFGVISFLVIVFIHPVVNVITTNIPKIFFKWIFRLILFLFIVDIIVTFGFRLG